MNRLLEETSLYLRQHADNPVDWQPWDQAALDSAREQSRPILLSIGYSACHWCHVMAHESFEDEATAEVMNRLFVNIKVDREERPDLDRIYQLAHQLLTGRGGGWPLTVFLDPVEHVPFFAGTYFPPVRRYGMPAFRELLQVIDQWFGENRSALPEQNAKLQAALESIQQPAPGEAHAGESTGDPDAAAALFAQAAAQARSRFDPEHGGFGGAPKFPQAPMLEAVAALAGFEKGLELDAPLEFTLRNMALGGLRDHLDGGFFRYCVDATWTIPHFEKMLYDNAMLLPLYAEAAKRTGDTELREAAEGIADWLEQSMRQASGAYAASIDADAGGEEGAFHVWTRDEVDACLGDPVAAWFGRAYGLDEAPNFEGRAWHLQRRAGTGELAAQFRLEPPELESALTAARSKLWKQRERRVHPTCDHKQLTSWNALLASGLVRAGLALNREDWLDRAEGIIEFMERETWTGDALLAVFNEGAPRFAAYLDDYAWLLQALLDLLSVRWKRTRLDLAIDVAEALLRRFEDPQHGGFFFSDSAVEVPMGRSMIFQDDATPAGNGSAILALNRLGHLLGEPRYLEAAERCLARALPAVRDAPLAHATLLRALRDTVHPPAQLIVAGNDPAACNAMRLQARTRHGLDCFVLTPAAQQKPPSPLPGNLGAYRTDQPAVAWLCRGTRCLPPVHSPDDLDRLMIETTDHRFPEA